MKLRVHLAHGASGSAASMQPWVRALAARGVSASAVQLPRGSAERAVPRYRATVPPSAASVVGGHSFGGRVASLLAAAEPYAGLVLLSFPLHPPGARERWDERTAHFARLKCPVLLLSGDRDPFARIELLREAATRLPRGRLVVYPGQRHGLLPAREAVADEITAFVTELATGRRPPQR